MRVNDVQDRLHSTVRAAQSWSPEVRAWLCDVQAKLLPILRIEDRLDRVDAEHQAVLRALHVTTNPDPAIANGLAELRAQTAALAEHYAGLLDRADELWAGW